MKTKLEKIILFGSTNLNDFLEYIKNANRRNDSNQGYADVHSLTQTRYLIGKHCTSLLNNRILMFPEADLDNKGIKDFIDMLISDRTEEGREPYKYLNIYSNNNIVMNYIRLLIARGVIDNNKIEFVFIDSNKEVFEISSNEYGELDNWVNEYHDDDVNMITEMWKIKTEL